MGKIIVIRGANFFANRIGTVMLDPDGEEGTYILQSINPTLIGEGTSLVNNTIIIGSQIASEENGYIRNILSTNIGSYSIRVCVIDGTTNEVLSISEDITLTGEKTFIRNLNIYVPKGAYIGYSVGSGLTGGLQYETNGGTPHFQANASVGAIASLSKFPTMKLSLGCEITLNSNGNIPDTPDEPDTPDTPDEPDTPDTPDEPDTPDTPDEPDDQKEYQTIEPSSDATTQFVNKTVFLGQSDIVAIKDGYISRITSAFDGSYSIRVCVIDGSTNEVLSVSDSITQTNRETDVRNQNIYVPKGARIGFGNGTGTIGGLMFTTSSGTKHFEAVETIGATANLSKFPTMKLSLGCVIELVE